MLVYEGVKSSFIDDVDLDVITEKIYEKYKMHFGRANASEINSWKNSMQHMRGVLSDRQIPDNAGIAVEFNIPLTSKRIDFIISGRDATKRDSVVIVELKQWDKCLAVSGKDGIVNTFVGGANRNVTHPSYQALSYANLIRDFNQTVQDDDINIVPCAFLHNYTLNNDDPICSDLYKEYIDQAPMFGHEDVVKLRNFIRKYVKTGDDKDVLYRIESGKLKPSKMLQDTLASMLQGNKEFTMIDDQKVIFEEAKSLALEANDTGTKKVLIVEGGPGTGKTVVAINLLVKIKKKGLTSLYVTKNSAPRAVFENKLKGIYKQKYINHLFKGSGSFVNTLPDEINVLIVDEAHRLREKEMLSKGENQVKEIIKAAQFSVFFIDESQKVTAKDIGSIELIRKYAKDYNAELYLTHLTSQFRCNGSDGYLAWLDDVLDIRQTANFDFGDLDIEYTFEVLDNPNELFDLIKEKNSINNKSRLVAGYCWEWIKNGQSNPDVYDIEIPEFGFRKSWNLNNTSTWAIDENSINEIGCIHTCQGLEFDYVGVILGEDIRFENGQVITDFTKRASSDKSLDGLKGPAKKNDPVALKEVDRIIRNTYKTLMTRGMKGCYIYCCDKALNEYFKTRRNQNRK